MRAILGAGVLPIFVLLVDSSVGRGQFINVPKVRETFSLSLSLPPSINIMKTNGYKNGSREDVTCTFAAADVASGRCRLSPLYSSQRKRGKKKRETVVKQSSNSSSDDHHIHNYVAHTA